MLVKVPAGGAVELERNPVSVVTHLFVNSETFWAGRVELEVDVGNFKSLGQFQRQVDAVWVLDVFVHGFRLPPRDVFIVVNVREEFGRVSRMFDVVVAKVAAPRLVAGGGLDTEFCSVGRHSAGVGHGDVLVVGDVHEGRLTHLIR